MVQKTKIVNLFGGPGVGKSTVATGVFSRLKQLGIQAEYVSEYAKDVTWEKSQHILENQIHVFGEQFRRQFRLLGQVEFVVTDSPLLLGAVYAARCGSWGKNPSFNEATANFIHLAFEQFDNINYVLARHKPYSEVGRNQTEAEARQIDLEVTRLLEDADVPYELIEVGNQSACSQIAHRLINGYDGELEMPRQELTPVQLNADGHIVHGEGEGGPSQTFSFVRPIRRLRGAFFATPGAGVAGGTPANTTAHTITVREAGLVHQHTAGHPQSYYTAEAPAQADTARRTVVQQRAYTLDDAADFAWHNDGDPPDPV